MRRGLFIALLGLWVTLVALGMFRVHRHAALPGRDTAAQMRWPAGTLLQRNPAGPTLLCFVHPRCPCTRASVRELERVMSHHRGAATVQVVFRDEGDDPTTSPTWEMAARVPGARRVRDLRGVEAQRFGARTSGLVLLYAADGSLRFRGGVTSARGHEGESAGAAALGVALGGTTVGAAVARVFGCGL